MTRDAIPTFRGDVVRCLAWGGISLAVAFPALHLAGVPIAGTGTRWLAVPSAALAAALLAALPVHVLRPLRRRAVGWALTGAAIALAIGGPLVMVIAVLYDPLGLRLFGVPQETARAYLPQAAVALSLVGGGIGGYLGYRERTDSSVF